MARMTKSDLVLARLKGRRGYHAASALASYAVVRNLPDVIYQLRKAGHVIETKMMQPHHYPWDQNPKQAFYRYKRGPNAKRSRD